MKKLNSLVLILFAPILFAVHDARADDYFSYTGTSNKSIANCASKLAIKILQTRVTVYKMIVEGSSYSGGFHLRGDYSYRSGDLQGKVYPFNGTITIESQKLPDDTYICQLARYYDGDEIGEPIGVYGIVGRTLVRVHNNWPIKSFWTTD